MCCGLARPKPPRPRQRCPGPTNHQPPPLNSGFLLDRGWHPIPKQIRTSSRMPHRAESSVSRSAAWEGRVQMGQPTASQTTTQATTITQYEAMGGAQLCTSVITCDTARQGAHHGSHPLYNYLSAQVSKAWRRRSPRLGHLLALWSAGKETPLKWAWGLGGYTPKPAPQAMQRYTCSKLAARAPTHTRCSLQMRNKRRYDASKINKYTSELNLAKPGGSQI